MRMVLALLFTLSSMLPSVGQTPPQGFLPDECRTRDGRMFCYSPARLRTWAGYTSQIPQTVPKVQYDKLARCFIIQQQVIDDYGWLRETLATLGWVEGSADYPIQERLRKSLAYWEDREKRDAEAYNKCTKELGA